ncbi:MAG: phospholipid carrier-dependent glycosyltransferase [Armatimonadetes bacterium]|nr:phospholipid carrier-dependent glycosyltransferase [Armatimonadota bacterium]
MKRMMFTMITQENTYQNQHSPTRFSINLGEIWALGIIIIAAEVVRLYGIRFGLPLVLNNDETFLVQHALAIRWSDLNPHAFVWGSLPFYILAAVFNVSNYVNILINQNPLAMQDFYYIGRMVSAFLGTASVALVFLWASILGCSKAGWLSAALLAFSPYAVQASHYAVVEPMLGFWVTLSMLGMALWLKRYPGGLYVASIAAGLAIATKYNAAILLVCFVTTILYIDHKEIRLPLTASKRLWIYAISIMMLCIYIGIVAFRSELLDLAASWTNTGQIKPVYIQIFNRILLSCLLMLLLAASLSAGIYRNKNWANQISNTITNRNLLYVALIVSVAFLLASPFVILDFPAFVQGTFFVVAKQISPNMVVYPIGSQTYAIADKAVPATDPFYYIRGIYHEWGAILLMAASIGLWLLWRRNRPMALIIMIFSMMMLLVTATGHYQGIRFVYPLWGIIALLSGSGVYLVIERIFQSIHKPLVRSLLIASLLFLLFWFPAESTCKRIYSDFLRKDTRNIALDWIETHVKPGTMILRENQAPGIEEATQRFHVYRSDILFEEASLAEWEEKDAEVIIITDRRYQFYLKHSSDLKDVLDRYIELRRRWKLMVSITPDKEIKGPAIHIYGKPSLTWLKSNSLMHSTAK